MTDFRSASIPPRLLERFIGMCQCGSDISEHLGTLWGLARQCQHVTEFGVRGTVSTTALLAAQPRWLVCYDVERRIEVDELLGLAGRTEMTFTLGDSRTVSIAHTDLLHIDTRHDYDQLRDELNNSAGRVHKWIALHDTTTFGERGESGGDGLWQAIEELLAAGEWRLLMRFTNNNGFTVLERINK
jgi:hypothetical protein